MMVSNRRRMFSVLLALGLAMVMGGLASAFHPLAPPSGDAQYQLGIKAILDARWEDAENHLVNSGTAGERLPPGARLSYLLEQVRDLRLALSYPAGSFLPAFLPHYNQGCGYHNLFLYLRRHHGIVWMPLVLAANDSYALARAFNPRQESPRICLAGLWLEMSNPTRAQELMATLDESRIEDYYDMMNLAYFYSAARNPEKSVYWLEEAMYQNLEDARNWAQVSNDFDNVRDDGRFQRLLTPGYMEERIGARHTSEPRLILDR